MSLYAEAAYFDNEPVQHCADRDEAARIDRKRLAAKLKEAERLAKMPGVNPALTRAQVPQFQAGLDAILSLPKLRRQLKSLNGDG
ncbi:hypothetical protein [Sphingobium olei]|uniref:Uncharacterized protein n=1 Tax=Sphingobium olei TaxID=420955 RepID=A0ABW3NZ11_9SPHN